MMRRAPVSITYTTLFLIWDLLILVSAILMAITVPMQLVLSFATEPPLVIIDWLITIHAVEISTPIPSFASSVLSFGSD